MMRSIYQALYKISISQHGLVVWAVNYNNQYQYKIVILFQLKYFK